MNARVGGSRSQTPTRLRCSASVDTATYDELGRALAGVTRLVDNLLAADRPPARDELQTLRVLCRKALQVVAAVVEEVDGCRWSTSFEEGLRAVAAEYGHVTGASPHVQIVGSTERFSPQVADAFRTVVTEALRNVDYYSRASILLVSLTVEEERATLDVVDDGIDLERRQVPTSTTSVELALRRMGRAMHEVGGGLSIHPLNPRGLRLRAWAPPGRAP